MEITTWIIKKVMDADWTAATPNSLGKGVQLMGTYEAMDLMVNFATLIVAVIAFGITANKKK